MISAQRKIQDVSLKAGKGYGKVTTLLAIQIMNNPFEYIPDAECEKAFRKLVARLERLRKSGNPDDIDFCRELDAGKMLGVLIAADASGVHHTLYAFSGQLGDGGFYREGFVGPVFDYLRPDGYFKTKEADISRQNKEIALFEENTLARIRSRHDHVKDKLDAQVSEYKERCRLSKLERDARRKGGAANDEELVAMIRQSQFEKAELRRIRKRLEAEIEPFAVSLKEAQSQLDTLKRKRHSDSETLQKWLFSNFRVLNAHGESRSLSDIFAATAMKIPPSGAGECCAPKLLQAAYQRGWHPIAMAEYWYGKPKGGEIRIQGRHYPACRGKCLPVLGWMLQGLDIEPPLGSGLRCVQTHNPEIIYENEWFCVVDKPSGMLSVPGKGSDISVQRWLSDKYGPDRDVRMAHRLDQDTSGLIIAAFGRLSYKVMQTLFATHGVKKTYIADLEGDYDASRIPRRGRIALPLSPDWLDRPRQRVDMDDGKGAVTEYEFIGMSEGRSRIMFAPLTGRTHQLRVHSASEMGLGIPIVGDPLYGKSEGKGSERLHLHAHRLEFSFPIDGHLYCFESPVPFSL